LTRRRTLYACSRPGKLPSTVGKWFDADGRLLNGPPEAAVDALHRLRDANFPQIRISQEVGPWLENRRRVVERRQLRHEYELKVQGGRMAGP